MPTVKHQSEMDTETFLKHMNARHVGAAGLTAFGKSNVPGDEDEHLLRALHDHVHEKDTQNHDHREAPE